MRGYELFKQTIAKKKNISLFFVRHGQSDGNTLGRHCLVNQDTPLTMLGKQQAEVLGEYFKNLPTKPAAIYSSIRERTLLTATAITAATGAQSHTSKRLAERDWGAYDCYTWASLAERLDMMSLEDRYTFVPEGGESWKDLEDRLFGVLTIMVEAANDNDSIVVMTHHGCLRTVLPLLDGKDIKDHKEYSVDNGSVTKYNSGLNALEFVNLVPEIK